MGAFHPTVRVELATQMILLCYHGSPHSNTDSIRATSPDAELESYFEDQTAQIFAGGHTHQPFLRRHQDRWMMNPGSVGLPFAWNTRLQRTINLASAEYALLTWQNNQLTIDFHVVPFDFQLYAQRVHAAGMPYAEWFLDHWYTT
jgi:predicted phosphodiesterase